MTEASRSLRVFISYARSDSSAFAEELLAGLEAAGFDPFLDRQDIGPGEPWEERLGALLQQADTVVYVISTASIASIRCTWEIDLAEKLSKRVIPVVAIEVAEADTPAKLRRLNYIFFSKGHSFGAALRELSIALRTDLTWVREHTRLADLAARWRDDHRPDDRLLRGTELTDARAWLVGWKPESPEPTSLHRDFINDSEAAEVRRNGVEQKRLEEVARVQSEKERALTRFRRAVFVGGALVAGLLVVVGILFASYFKGKAELDETRVQLADANKLAEETREALERARANLSSGANALASAEATTPGTGTPEKRQTVAAIQALVQQTRVNLGWSIDVFWCSGADGVQNKARAEAITQLLADERRRQAQPGAPPTDGLAFAVGQVRLRELTEVANARTGYQIHDDVVRPDGDELKQAEALRAFVQRRQETALRTSQSAMQTPSYLSAFLCAGTKR